MEITYDSSSALADGFLKDQFDLVIGASTPELNKDNGWICKRLSFPVRLFGPNRLVAEIDSKAKQFHLSDLTEVFELANSKKIPIILPKCPCNLRDETEKFISHSKIRPLKTIECNSTSAIVELIERKTAEPLSRPHAMINHSEPGQIGATYRDHQAETPPSNLVWYWDLLVSQSM